MFLSEIICWVNGSQGVEVGTGGHFLCASILIFESLKNFFRTSKVHRSELIYFVIFLEIGQYGTGQNFRCLRFDYEIGYESFHEKVLSQCTTTDDTLYLPSVTLLKSLYQIIDTQSIKENELWVFSKISKEYTSNPSKMRRKKRYVWLSKYRCSYLRLSVE